MIGAEQIRKMLLDLESDRIERTIATTNTDKFGEAICAFANDLPCNNKPGYLIIGAEDNGAVHPINVTDKLLRDIAAIRTDGNIQPQPSMNVQKVSLSEGDIIVVEVQPASFPPVKYKGKIYIRVGPRKGVASQEDEHQLYEKRASHITTFDAMPCIGCSIEDLDTSLFKQQYLPKAYPEDVLKEDGRSVEAQMQSLGFFDMRYNCPTYAGIIFFGKNVERHLPGAYIQYVRFGGTSRSAEVRSEYKFLGSLCKMLSQLDTFVDTTIVNRRPIPVSTLREETIIDYPHWAMRELLMNAVCHRDYEGNGPIQFYQYDNRIEIINPGGLYGKATKENFPTVNDYRNPIIAEGMKVLGFVNRFSRGVFRVEDELKENGNGTPNFQLNLGTAFLVSVALSESALKYYPIEEVTESETKEKNKASATKEKDKAGESKEKDNPLNATQTAPSAQAKTKKKDKASGTKEKNKASATKEKNKVSATKEKNKAVEGKEKESSRKEKANQLEEAIIRIISSDSRVTYAQLAKQLEFSESSIYSAIRHLKSIGRLRREGGRKLGRWIVINLDTK